MKRSRYRPLGFIAAALFTIAAGAADRAASPALARVNGDPISADDVRAEFVQRHGGHAKFLGGTSEVRQFLNVMIDNRLLVQEAARLNLQDDPVIKSGTTIYEDGKLAAYFTKVEIEEKAKPTKEEIEAAWKLNTNELFVAREIVVDTREDAIWVFLQLLEGADFDSLARSCSISKARIHGGQLSPIGWGGMEPEWEENVFALSPGELSTPFWTPRGWTVAQLDDRVPVERPELKLASSRIETILKTRKLGELSKALDEFLWSKYDVKIALPDLKFETLHAAMGRDPGGDLVTWRGGRLSLRDFVARVDPSRFSAYSSVRLPELIREQLHEAVKPSLIALEARERNYQKVPEIAAAVHAYRDGLMLGALTINQIVKDVRVADAEVRKQYDQHKATYSEPEKRRISQIVFKTLEEAKAAKAKLAAGSDFAAMAKKVSTDPISAPKGGDLGLVSPKEIPQELSAVLSLKEGEISEPLQTKFGYHLFKVAQIVSGSPMSFDNVKEKIKKDLTEQKERKKRADWVLQIRKVASIKIDDAQIEAFVKSNEAAQEWNQKEKK